MSMKNSNDTIGNRSRDLPVCGAVPQPLRYRVPPALYKGQLQNNNILAKNTPKVNILRVVFIYFLLLLLF
jgi:hypothetical protein